MRRCVIQLMFGCGGQAWRSTDVDSFFFFNDTATTEIYTLSLHDALPISWVGLDVAGAEDLRGWKRAGGLRVIQVAPGGPAGRAGVAAGGVLVDARGRRLRPVLPWGAGMPGPGPGATRGGCLPPRGGGGRRAPAR